MPNPVADIKTLSAQFPIALFPVRIETRFIVDPRELRIRVYPDEIAADLHQPALTADEELAGTTYWNAAWEPTGELDAWRRLVLIATPERAAWIVRATTPTNVATRPTGSPMFPTVPLRDRQLPAAVARTLPSCWVAVAYRGGTEIVRAVGNQIIEPLAMSYRPTLAEDSPELVNVNELMLEPELMWAIDWSAAVSNGMGLALPLTGTDLEQGFDRLIVVGVRTHANPQVGRQALEQLLDSHHYTRGLALVAQGTPTNNSGEGTSAYPPPADPVRSHKIEIAPTVLGPTTDAAVLARALGVSTAVFEHVDGAAWIEQQRARAMNEALWPCTMGYYLEQLATPLVTAANLRATRDHFAAFVRGRGPLPAFRVGRVPYGVLPTVSLRSWKESASSPTIDQRLPQMLEAWRAVFLQERDKIARTGRTGDPDADLLEVLSIDASSREVRSRETLGPAYVKGILQLFGQPSTIDDAARTALVTAVLARAQITDAPRVTAFTWADDALRISRPLVTSEVPSELATLSPNYIQTLRTTSQMAELRAAGQPNDRHDKAPLLFYLLRQGALVECARIGVELAIAAGVATALDRVEPELIRIAPRHADAEDDMGSVRAAAPGERAHAARRLVARSGVEHGSRAHGRPRFPRRARGARADTDRGARATDDRDARHVLAPARRVDHVVRDQAARGDASAPAGRDVPRRVRVGGEPAPQADAAARHRRRPHPRAVARARCDGRGPAQRPPDTGRRGARARHRRPVVGAGAPRARATRRCAPGPARRRRARLPVRARAPRRAARSVHCTLPPEVPDRARSGRRAGVAHRANRRARCRRWARIARRDHRYHAVAVDRPNEAAAGRGRGSHRGGRVPRSARRRCRRRGGSADRRVGVPGGHGERGPRGRYARDVGR
ncbi:MAG: hypothetical protein KIT31_03845 [Deltaproteobacteria bacterium]|nr:hypothetical protein [Deltaproteobacteria bacterium]